MNQFTTPIYVMTNDLVPYTEKILCRKLSDSSRSRIKEIGNVINGTVRYSLSNIKFLEIEFNSLRRKLSELELQGIQPVITVDPLYSSSPYVIEYNRIMYFDEKGNLKQTEGPRPGFPSIEYQTKELARKLKERKISLSDVGTWKGNTAIHLEKELRKYRVSVDQVIFGIAGIEALENLRNNGINSALIGDTYNFYDWLEQRDYLIGGRLLGNYQEPYLIQGRVPVRIPYYATEKTLEDWASIPTEKSIDVRRSCINQLCNFLDLLEDELERPVQLRDTGLLIPTNIKPSDLEKKELKPEDGLKDVLPIFWKNGDFK